MARIRSAKPEFWTDPLMCSLSRDIRFTFKGIWEVCADDFGRFQADPRLVKSQVWPLDDDISVKKVARYLAALVENGRIQLYKVGGLEYGQVVNWSKHQKVAHPTDSRIPLPDAQEPSTNGSREIHEPEPKNSPRSGAERIGEERSKSGAEVEISVRQPPANGTAPPAPHASPLAELPAVKDFVRTFYPKASTPPERRKDIAAQLEATLTVGAKHKRQLVHAYSPQRLESKCREVIAEGVRDPDKAIVVLLTKLGDTTDNGAPGQGEEQRAAQERVTEERTSAHDYEHAEAWIASDPDAQATFEILLADALELHDMPLGSDDTLDPVQLAARRIVRRNLALMHWRNSGAPIVETAS